MRWYLLVVCFIFALVVVIDEIDILNYKGHKDNPVTSLNGNTTQEQREKSVESLNEETPDPFSSLSIESSNAYSPTYSTQHEDLVTTCRTYWNGPIDETLLICWFYNYKHPEIHQVFYIENCPDFQDYAQRYPFMNELDVVWLDNWEDFFATLNFDYHSEVPHYVAHNAQPQQKSDVFEYAMLLHNNGTFYADADQCFFNFDKIRDVDLVVYDQQNGNPVYISNGVFKITEPQRVARISELLLKDFQYNGKMMTFNPKSWGVIGPTYFTAILHRSGYSIEHTIPMITFETKEMYGWNWFDNTLEFCDVWNGALNRTGLHLYRDRRMQHRAKILQLLQRAMEHPASVVTCS